MNDGDWGCRRTPRIAYLAFGWASLFAGAHLYWALVGCLGFPADDCEAGFQSAWFTVYNAVAGVLCVVGAVVALALVRSRVGSAYERVCLALALVGGAVLILRGGIGVVQDGFILMRGGLQPTMIYDPWFLLGGVLFLAAWRGSRRRRV